MKKISLYIFFSLLTVVAFAQQRQVSGKITDNDGNALPGVTIFLKGTTTGTNTNSEGVYQIMVPEEGGTLRFTFFGMEPQELEIGTNSTIDLVLSEDVQQLSEVVILAYGAQSERLNVQQVETIDQSAFENFPILSPQEALQGQAAGVQVNGSSGLLGANQVMRIRGVTSLTSGNNPLYVIDGVPLNDGGGRLEGYSDDVGATRLNPLFDLNPNDIEKVTILKDASATALYGSRGANGVVMITTKSGALNQKTEFNFDYFTAWSEPTVLKEVLSFDQWNQLQQDLGNPASDSEGFNWADAVIRTGRTHSYSASARGGNEKTTFYVGGSYVDNEAYLIGNDVQKLNGRLNLAHTANDVVKIGVNLAMSRLDNDRVFAENSTGSPLTVGYLNTPDLLPRDENGNLQDVGFNNPMLLEEVSEFTFISTRTTGNVYAEVTPFAGLKLRTDWGIDMLQTDTEARTPEILSPGGSASKEIITDNKWLTTNTADYTFNIGQHTFNALAGFSFETARREDIETATSDFISDALPNTTSGATLTTAADDASEWAISSFFGRVNYNFGNRYIVEGSLRRDGSSRFGPNKKYGTFWAVSGGWLISEESFFPKNELLNFAKLTASYGTSGNDRIGNAAHFGLLAAGINYNGNPGLEASQPANPDLTWETTDQFNINLNVHFLESRIRLDADFWQKTTSGLLLDQPLPFTTGFPSRITNIGELFNRGVDINLAADIIDNSQFKWTISGNVGFLHNEVTELPDAQIDENGDNYVTQASFGSVRSVVGASSQEFFLEEYVGIDPETGDAQWIGEDGNVTNNYADARRVYAGSALPDFTGGITNTLRWNNLSLRILVNFVQGGNVYLTDNEFAENMALSFIFNNTTRVLDYWRQPGDIAFAPGLNSATLGTWDNQSTRHLFDASYLRIKNVTLSYNLPRNMAESTKVFNSARIYVMGQNLATLFSDVFDNGSDPEVNAAGNDTGTAQGESFFTSPQARTFTVGVSLGF